jgi:hypothetical protein
LKPAVVEHVVVTVDPVALQDPGSGVPRDAELTTDDVDRTSAALSLDESELVILREPDLPLSRLSSRANHLGGW